jgi:hypothetical protein
MITGSSGNAISRLVVSGTTLIRSHKPAVRLDRRAVRRRLSRVRARAAAVPFFPSSLYSTDDALSGRQCLASVLGHGGRWRCFLVTTCSGVVRMHMVQWPHTTTVAVIGAACSGVGRRFGAVRQVEFPGRCGAVGRQRCI